LLLLERADGVRIIRITRPEEAIAYRSSFAGAYQDIFSEPPYNERIMPEEAQGVLQQYLQVPENLVLLAVTGRARVVGFGIGVPLTARPDINRHLRGLLEIRHTFYLADLGVLGSFRGSGLGRQLVEMRLDLVDRQRYTHVVLRTSAVRNASYEMYMRMNFDDMGVYMEVPHRRMDGTVSTDRRLFLSRVMPTSEVRQQWPEQPSSEP
jgi:ribosomal protein S18 acetylase RimI-like enzyme